MIVSMAIVTGFQKEITDKVVNFGADIIITDYSNLNAIEPQPVSKEQDFYPSLTEIDGIRHIQVFATKAGIVKTDEEIEGVVVKGVGSDFDWSFFQRHLIDGQVFETTDSSRSKNILISESISKKLKLNVGDRMEVFFIQEERQRARVFDVTGIYKTGLAEYDERYVITDITHIQRLNGWSSDQVAGFEVFVDDFGDLDELEDVVYHSIGNDLYSATVKDLQPQIFDWLDLQDMNVRVIIILMLVVAGFTHDFCFAHLVIERVYNDSEL